jgi:cephalosporin-C deacetylase-like acetyl esterase
MSSSSKYMKMCKFYGLVLFASLYISIGALSQPEVSLLDYWEYYSDHKNTLYKNLTDIAFAQLNARENVIASITEKTDWEKRQKEVREKLKVIIGEFPEKTPLNPVVTGILKGDGFRVEKVIYESQPGLHVTAALFIPDGLEKKAPAILYCSGHTFDSFRSDTYQHAIINLVQKGFIVLAFDPVGQGERLQYLDKKGRNSIYRTPTHEHSYVGGQCFISGHSLAKYMIWDGIRSIDYLTSRVEVDPDRIGITGRSGGGTQTVYISAYDDRILAAAPENYVTSFRYLLESIGPQDAEQNLPYLLKNNLDFADLLIVRTPKPTLIVSTLNDFFSIQGARETFNEVRSAYMAFDKVNNLHMTEDEAEHASTLKNRETTYAFFQKHLNNPGDSTDIAVTKFDKKELIVTSTGQVTTDFHSESIFSLNQKASIGIIEDRSRQLDSIEHNHGNLTSVIRNLTGYEEPESEDKYIFSGTVRHNNFTIEKYLLHGKNIRLIPLVVMIPDSLNKEKAIVLLNPDGKEKELSSGLPEYFASKGYYVILPDITGAGELAPEGEAGDSYISHSSYNKWYAGILTGKSIVGLRMEDISRVCVFLNRHYGIGKEDLYGMARNIFTSDILHAGIMTENFSKIALIDPLISYKTIVLNRDYDPLLIQSSIAGVLKQYDLPDLIAGFAPSKMLMINIRDQLGKIINIGPDNTDLNRMKEGYQRKSALENFEIRLWDDDPYDTIFEKWLE